MRGAWLSIAAVALMTAACAIDGAVQPATLTPSQIQALAPTLSLNADAQPNGDFALRASVSAPGGGRFTLSWTADGGTLSGTDAPAILWRPPATAGTFTVSVAVVTASGVARTVSQRFVINAAGKASLSGSAVVSSAQAASSGQFVIPSPVGGVGPSPILVGTPEPQVVASSGAAASPTPPPQNPFAQPTPTPTPTPLSPSPTPPGPLSTVAPSAVPTIPPAYFRQVAPVDVGVTRILRDVHFPRNASGGYREGWVVGDARTVLYSSDGGLHWSQRASGITAGTDLRRVHFISVGGSATGFACGTGGGVFKTTNGGSSWTRISSDEMTDQNFTGMIVYNASHVDVLSSTGDFYRSVDADQATPNWDLQNTATGPAGTIHCSYSNADDLGVGYYGGDGVYLTDDTGTVWTRRIALTDEATAIATPQTNSAIVWLGLESGALRRSNDRGATWTSPITTLYKKNNNGINTTFSLTSTVTAIDFVDPLNGWVMANHILYKTDDGGTSWVSNSTAETFSAMEMRAETISGQRQFVGWAVGPEGGIFRYVSTDANWAAVVNR